MTTRTTVLSLRYSFLRANTSPMNVEQCAKLSRKWKWPRLLNGEEKSQSHTLSLFVFTPSFCMRMIDLTPNLRVHFCFLIGIGRGWSFPNFGGRASACWKTDLVQNLGRLSNLISTNVWTCRHGFHRANEKRPTFSRELSAFASTATLRIRPKLCRSFLPQALNCLCTLGSASLRRRSPYPHPSRRCRLDR